MWEKHHLFDPQTIVGALRYFRTPFNNPGKPQLYLAPMLRTSTIFIAAS